MNLKNVLIYSALSIFLVSNFSITASFAETEKKNTEKVQTVSNEKPIVAVVKAEWCPACKKIGPTVMEIMKEYDQKVNFVVLDVTNKASSKEAEKMATKNGISKFFKDNKQKTSTVAIIDSKSKKVLKEFFAEGKKEAYEVALNDLLKK